MKLTGLGIAGFVALALLATIVFGSWYTIDQGERGVILRNGAVIGIAEPGLHFKLPLIDSVARISVQTRIRNYPEVLSYSRDQQAAALVLSVNYRIPPDRVGEVYERFGGEEGLAARLIDPRVNKEFKNVFGSFNAVTAVQERDRLNLEGEEAIREAVDGPVIIESLNIENMDFSDAYEQSIEARMLAEVEVQKIRQNAEREKVQAEIVVIQARATADAVRATAEAEADKARLIGEGAAEAIRARGAALRDNPLLVQLTIAEKWDGTLPTTIPPNATVPLLSLPVQ